VTSGSSGCCGSTVGVCADGASVAEVCRRHGLSTATFQAWKARFGGLEGEPQANEAKRLKALGEYERAAGVRPPFGGPEFGPLSQRPAR
jgi:Transposase